MAEKIVPYVKTNRENTPPRVAFHLTLPPGSYVVDRIYKGSNAGAFVVSKVE